MSERNSWRYPLFSSSLTSILNEMQSSILWSWPLWNSNHRFGFQNSLGSSIFWGHLTYGSIYFRTLTDSNFEMKRLEMSDHVDTSIDLAFYIGWLLVYATILASCPSSSYFTYAQVQDIASSMVMHWYFVSFLYRFPSGSMPILMVEIAVEALPMGMDTFSWSNCVI